MATRASDDWAAYVRELGLGLNRRRTAANLSQERLAHAAGVTRGYYQQLEQGTSRTTRVANPTLQTLVSLAQALDTTVSELLPPNPPDMTAGR